MFYKSPRLLTWLAFCLSLFAPRIAFGQSLQTIQLTPNAVQGGTATLGKITLSGKAPAGGVLVTLRADKTSANPPASVTIAAGTTGIYFSIPTSPVGTTETSVITATSGAKSIEASVTILPPALASFSIAPASVVGGTSALGKLKLSSKAPSGGFVVSLRSNAAATQLAETIAIPEGYSGATFPINTTPVRADETATVTATAGDASFSATLIVAAPQIDSLALTPASVLGGNSSIGKVKLNGKAPTGGIAITLHSDVSVALLPATITIPQGSAGAQFSVATVRVASQTVAHIEASTETQSVLTTLNIAPPALDSFRLVPESIASGNASQGVVRLTGRAPAGGLTVQIDSNKTFATVPAFLVVPEGAFEASFPIATQPLDHSDVATFSVTANRQTLTASLSLSAALTPPPEGFAWTPPFALQWDSDRQKYQILGYNFDALAPTGKTYYVSPDGNDANLGTSPTAPLRRVSVAVQKRDVARVLIAPGVYAYGEGWDGATPSNSMSVGVYGSGEVILSAHLKATYAQNDTFPNVYQTNSATAVLAVRDARFPDSNGDYAALQKAASLQEVAETAGSWFYANGTFYVHLSEDRAPDSDLRPYLNIPYSVRWNGTNKTLFIKGIQIHGGAINTCEVTGNNQTACLQDCEFKYGPTANAFAAYGGNVYLLRCVAAQSGKDGFNWNAQSTAGQNALEYDCIARYTGGAGVLNQCSTTHGNVGYRVCIIRINGDYQNPGDQVIADFGLPNGLGGHTWMLNCSMRNALSNSQSGIHMRSLVGVFAECWLERCSISGCGENRGLFADRANISLRNVSNSNGTLSANGGTFKNY